MSCLPWTFVTPSVAGAREDGKLSLNLPWDRESRLADVSGEVVLYIEGARQISAEAPVVLCSVELRVDLCMTSA